ncbi:MAG: hypothetical protein IT166_08055 [Bryobacterales bacterium]|nr:hypothetical protein [Bryobacterales bacterium]
MPDEVLSMATELIVLAVLTAAVIGLALYRHLIAQKQDFHLHTETREASIAGRQSMTAGRLLAIDRWGKVLTVVTIVYFLALLAWVLYREFQKSANQILMN